MEPDSFPPIKKRKGGKVFILSCGHFTDCLFKFRSQSYKYFNSPVDEIPMVYSCDICDRNKEELPKDYEVKDVPTVLQYLCWDCKYQWISDIPCNVYCDLLRCSNCGSFNKKSIGNKKRDPIESRLRHEVFKRDNYKCKECGKTKKNTTLHVDHILPVVQGGTDELDNLQTLCQACNLAKSNKKWKASEVVE